MDRKKLVSMYKKFSGGEEPPTELLNAVDNMLEFYGASEEDIFCGMLLYNAWYMAKVSAMPENIAAIVNRAAEDAVRLTQARIKETEAGFLSQCARERAEMEKLSRTPPHSGNGRKVADGGNMAKWIAIALIVFCCYSLIVIKKAYDIGKENGYAEAVGVELPDANDAYILKKNRNVIIGKESGGNSAFPSP